MLQSNYVGKKERERFGKIGSAMFLVAPVAVSAVEAQWEGEGVLYNRSCSVVLKIGKKKIKKRC